MENVPAIFNPNHLNDFKKWEDFLKSLNYHNTTFTLNAKDFGIAQNRKRAFMVSILDGKPNDFIIPIGNKKAKKIKNFLETEPKIIEYFDTSKYPLASWKPEIRKTLIGSTDILNYSTFSSEAKAYSIEGISPTITATGAHSRLKIILTDKDKVRYLTPLETWKLMGFNKSDYLKALKTNCVNKNQLIKQAGNSIVVNVLEAIFQEMLKNEFK